MAEGYFFRVVSKNNLDLDGGMDGWGHTACRNGWTGWINAKTRFANQKCLAGLIPAYAQKAYTASLTAAVHHLQAA